MPEIELIGAYTFSKSRNQALPSMTIHEFPLLEVLVRNADERFLTREFSTVDPETGRTWPLGATTVLAWLDESGESVLSHHDPPETLPASYRLLFTLTIWREGDGLSSSYGVMDWQGLQPAPERVLELLPADPPAATARTGMRLLGVYRPADATESSVPLDDLSTLTTIDERMLSEDASARVISRVLVDVMVTDPEKMYRQEHFGQFWDSFLHGSTGYAWKPTYVTVDGTRVLSVWEPPRPPLPLEFRVLFYLHPWVPELPLSCSYGSMQTNEPLPLPEQLRALLPFERVSPLLCDPSALSFAEWLAFFFDQPTTEGSIGMLDRVSPDKEVRFVWSDRVLEYMTRLFKEFGTIAPRYSLEQVNQGIWTMLGKGGEVTCCLWDPFLPLSARLECIRAMYRPFADFLAGHQADVIENCFYMWLDSIVSQADSFPRGGEPSKALRATLEVVFETLCAILAIDDGRCQEAALHGLGHLQHPERGRVVQEFIDAHGAEGWRLEWLEECRDGTVM